MTGFIGSDRSPCSDDVLLLLRIHFLDMQVSPQPTPVRWSKSWSHFRISNLWSVMVAQKKMKKKNKVHLFSNFASGKTLPTHRNVYEGLNALKCI